jgi:glutathione S-transferase
MRLHVFPPSPNAIAVMAAGHLLGLPFEVVHVDLFKGDQRTRAFTALNPNQRMPVLEDGDFVLWESNAILQYLASKRPERGYWPADPRRQADVARWQFWQTLHWGPICGTYVFERIVKRIMALGPANEMEVTRVGPDFERAATVLNGWLRGRPWVTGDAPTVADVSLGAWMVYAEAAAYPLAAHPEIRRWYAALAALPGWQRALPSPQTGVAA